MRAKILERVRRICLALPDTQETNNFGHEWFRVREKAFCIFSGTDEEPLLSVKVPKRDQSLFLQDARFIKTPYIGQHGWISLQTSEAKVDWEEMTELIQASYEICRPKRLN